MDVKTILLIMLLFLIGCSSREGSPKGDVLFSFTSGLSSSDIKGGVYIKCINRDESALEQEILFALNDENTATIPIGNWDVYLVAFKGPSNLLGDRFCGTILNLELEKAEQSVDLSINGPACLADPFPTIITEIKQFASNGSSFWGSAVWGNAVWGP